MRRWLPRSLWLLAWSLWAWCGFELHRELPRELGPIICRIPQGDFEVHRGFLAAGDDLLCTAMKDDKVLALIRDAHTGAIKRDISTPASFDQFGTSYFLSLRHGYLITELEAKDDDSDREHCAIDLGSGAVVRQPKILPGWLSVHPNHPWMLSCRFAKCNLQTMDGTKRTAATVSFTVETDEVSVSDLKTGSSIFSWRRSPLAEQLREASGPPFFTTDGRLLAIPTVAPDLANPKVSDLRLEFYALDDAAKPVAVLPGVVAQGSWCTSSNGRIVCQRAGGGQSTVEVLDILTGRRIAAFSDPTNDEGKPSDYQWAGATLSRNGQSVMQPQKVTIWNVDTARPTWCGKKKGFELDTEFGDDVFGAWEHGGMAPGFPFFGRAAYVCRDHSDGSLVYRCSEPTILAPATINAARTLHLDQDNCIRDFPPRVNYFVLAACQTTLTLPLVLAWLALRWRRKRRLRLAGAAS